MNNQKLAEKGVFIEEKYCKKCGRCVLAYPEIFYFDKNFKVKIKNEKNIDGEITKICPHGAIAIK